MVVSSYWFSFCFFILQRMLLILTLIFYVVHAQQIRKDILSHPNWPLLSDLQEDCGYSASVRIIGGVNASLGQYPWIARLGYSYDLESGEPQVDIYECGGAIINERYVLTASHCSPDHLGIKLLEIRLGEYYTETNPDCVNGVCAPPVQDIEVEEYTCHKQYNTKNFRNDICLIRLARPIQFNDYVQPICLPIEDSFQTNNFEKSIMEVAGWGIYDLGIGKPHTILQVVKVPITNQKACEIAYKSKAQIYDSQFCAGGKIGEDSCSGDSGGPLMRPFAINGPPKYYVVGIVSFGPRKCAATNSPGVYSKVSFYIPWILDHIRP